MAFHRCVNVYLPGEYGVRHLFIRSSAICVSLGEKFLSLFRLLLGKTIGYINDKHIFCIILETGKSKNKVLDNPVSNEGPCAGSYFSYCLLTWWNGKGSSLGTLDKGTNSIHKYSTLKA